MQFGSSPLTRGKHTEIADLVCAARLIPAHAGKTSRSTPSIISVRAHPRSRGENVHERSAARRAKGSSPLTRGKPHLVVVGEAIRRLIPAHAGKTDPSRGVGSCTPAHPRSRGENCVTALFYLSVSGSSPLTRGKQSFFVRRQPRGRLIPAHAGKTTRRVATSTGTTAHPRSRGENWHRACNHSSLNGSSPLTRGKLSRRACARLACRLIPAHAGKTRTPRRYRVNAGAHPRSRGEN